MNIFRYIDKYGNYSFDDKEFNDVDNLIFSALSYIDLDDYVSKNFFNKKSIKEVGDSFFKDFDKKTKNITAVKNGIKVLRYIKDTNRYKNLLLYNYAYVGDNNEQFGAITIEINNHLVYVSFEGTDHLISGWKEDFMMSYTFPVLSQKLSIKYINKFTFSNKKIILGGHSKGGNLAMVSGMYANIFVKNKIIKIYNNDGPGFRRDLYNSDRYNKIISKLICIIPNYSVVGLLLFHGNDYKIVKSLKRGLYAHNLANWVIDEDKLCVAKLSGYSKLLDKAVSKWLDKYNDIEKETFVRELFFIFDKAKIVDILDVIKNKKLIFSIIRETKGIDKKTKEMIMDFVYLFFDLVKENTTNEIEELIANKLNIKLKNSDNLRNS